MGNTSSQPSPLPPQRAVSPVRASPSARHGPHYSPEFDDVAASQQLLDEVIHSESIDFSPILQTTFRKASRRASPSPSLHTLSEPHAQSPSDDHDTVEAPSDKAELSESRLPSLPPSTPSTGTVKTKSTKKRTRGPRAEVDVHNILPEQTFSKQSEDGMSTPSALRSRRKRKHADSTEPVTQSQSKSAGSAFNTRKRIRVESRSGATSKATVEEGSAVHSVSAENELIHREPQLTPATLTPDSLPQSSPSVSNKHTSLTEADDMEQEERDDVDDVDLLLSNVDESETNAHRLSKFTSINGRPSSGINIDEKDGRNDDNEQEDAFPNVRAESDAETTNALENNENDDNDNNDNDDHHTETKVKPKGGAKQASAKLVPMENSHKLPLKTKRKGKSNVDSTEDKRVAMSAAERALNTERKLKPEPDIRSEGAFTNDEEERVRRAVLSYQKARGLSIPDLVEIIQLRSESQGIWKSSSEREQLSRESKQFWSEIQQLCPKRAGHNFRTQVRARYHLYKSGTWSGEEDEQLRKLTRAYPKQWPLIYQMMPTRSPPSIQNRWRDYIQYGDTRTTKKWSEEDEELFVRAVSIAAQRTEDERATAGKPPITHYSRSDIDWKVVCAEMGKVRNRIQCAEHWEVMSARPSAPEIRVEIKPRKSHTSEETVMESHRKHKQPLNVRTPTKPKPSTQLKKRGRRQLQDKDDNVSQNSKDAARVLKKRRKLKKSQSEAAEEDLDKSSQDEVLTAELSNEKSVSTPVDDTLDANNMRIGDKVNLLTAIINGQYVAEEDIDWQKTFETMEQAWPVEALQAGWRNLLAHVDGTQAFGKVLDNILEYLADNHGDEWDDCYVPLQGADAN